MKNIEKRIGELVDKSLTNTKPYFVSDTSPHSNLKGYCIKAIEDTVISAFKPLPQGNSIVGETILAGDVWYIPCTSITLTSGACFIYQH